MLDNPLAVLVLLGDPAGNARAIAVDELLLPLFSLNEVEIIPIDVGVLIFLGRNGVHEVEHVASALDGERHVIRGLVDEVGDSGAQNDAVAAVGEGGNIESIGLGTLASDSDDLVGEN